MPVLEGPGIVSKGDVKFQLFDKVVIIGVGLIGASLGMNLVHHRLAREVIGVGRSRRNLNEAFRRKAINRAVVSSQALPVLKRLGRNDLVVLAAPVETILDYLKALPRRPLVIDVGSTKGSIIKIALRRKLRFIGSHPIAGTEKGGAAAGERDLFRGRVWIVTPGRNSSPKDLRKLSGLIRRVGSKPVTMDPIRHDRLFAAISHLPHAAAFTLVASIPRILPTVREGQFGFGSLRDMTRVAASPPEVWRDIFLQNKTFLLRAITAYQKELSRLVKLIIKGRGLLKYLQTAQEVHRGLVS